MTDLRNQRRMAAAVLKCGQTRVWIDPLHADDVAAAVTRRDVAALIDKGTIKAHPKRGVSRARANKLAKQRAKGRRRGPGSRKGAVGGRDPRKRRWIRTIRPIREELKRLRGAKAIPASVYRRYYLLAKGGVFRSRAHLLSHMLTDGVINDEQAVPMTKRETPPTEGA